MNREIKFRAWNEVKQRMEHDVYKEYQNLMQYTGLKDKNGKEIYEGDIVYTDNYGEYPMVVSWDEEYAMFLCHDKSGDDDDDLNMIAVTKVIGNIYENPELIKD